MKCSRKKLVIVILNYEAYQETERCIASILARNIEFTGIVIVDNASKNESAQYLKEEFKGNDKITIVRSLQNVGFAKGNNIGIKVAKRKWDADFVLLLNSDTLIIQDDYVDKLCAAYEDGVATIQSKVIDTNDRYTNRLYTAYSKRELLWKSIASLCDAYDIYFPPCKISAPQIGPHITGCDWLLTPSFFKEFNGLYPLTFLFGEEEILMIMLKKAGLKSRIVEKACILHEESMSTPSDLKVYSRRGKQLLAIGEWHDFMVRMMPLKVLKKIVNYGEW